MPAVHDKLVRVAPPVGGGAGPVTDWPEFETTLGLGLPDDYKWLVDTYGPGTFGGFIHILQAASTDSHILLAQQIEFSRQDFARYGDRMHPPCQVGELVPVALTDNGDTLYWVANPVDQPELWTIVGNASRSDRWEPYEGGIVDFLVRVLAGEFSFGIFPRSFPGEHAGFSSY